MPDPAPVIRWTRMSAAVCGGVGELEGHDRAVLPEALEAVVDALLLVEHVHDQVAEVEKDPAGLCTTLATDSLVPRLDETILDLVGDRGDVALAVPGDEQEDVDERQGLRDVQRDEVLTALRHGGVCS